MCKKLYYPPTSIATSTGSSTSSGETVIPWEYYWFHSAVESEFENQLTFVPVPKMAVYKGDETTVIWSDNTRTSAKWMGGEDEAYDPEDAVALCVAYKVFGTKSAFRKFVSNGKFQMSKEEKQEIKADKKRRKLINEVSDALKGNEDNKVDQSTEDEFPF